MKRRDFLRGAVTAGAAAATTLLGPAVTTLPGLSSLPAPVMTFEVKSPLEVSWETLIRPDPEGYLQFCYLTTPFAAPCAGPTDVVRVRGRDWDILGRVESVLVPAPGPDGTRVLVQRIAVLRNVL